LTVAAGTLSIGSSTITVVNGAGSPLGAGDYVLINTNGTGVISGTPTLDTSSGVGAGTGMAVNTSVSLAYNSSGYLILHVTSSLPATTTTIALHSPWTSTNTYGDALQFTVTVSGGSSPGGMVTVYDGGSSGTVIGTNTLSGGSAIVTLNPLTGLSVGLHTNIVAVYAGDNNNQGSASSPLAAQTVNPKNLTVAGAAAIGKCYDGTTNGATITGTLSGVVGSDVVTLNGSGTFANAGPGTGIAVTTALTLVGAPATNYSLTQPTGLAANIVTNAPWNVAAGGAWETAGNWTNSIVATNTGNTADFTAVNLTADATITNNGPKTIGNLAFGDTDTSTPAGWTVSGSTLTLAATTPAITVNALGAGKNVTINSIIAGTNGLTKTGNGTLQLNGVNTYTNGTVVKAGVLNFGADSGFGAVPSSAATNNITLDGGTMTLTGNNQSLNANRGIWVTSNGGGISNSLVGTGNLNVLGIIDGPGMVTVGVVSQSGVLLSGANTYSGGTVLSGAANGNVFCMMNSAGPAGAPTSGTFGTGPVTFNGSGTRSTAGADTTVGNPIIFAADTTFPTLASEKSLTFNGPVTLTNGTRTLTVNIGATVAGKSLTLAGAIGDGGNGYGLTKAGTGVLNLTGINTYTGNTTVKAGTLSISNACLAAGSTISISNSAVLNLAFSTTNTVTGLITNGVSLTNGVYSSNNVAPFITGSGYLQVGITGPDLSQNRLTNSVTAGGTVLSLSWSPGWKLQAQTNSLSTGLSTNWTYVTDGTVNSTNLPIVLGNPTVFYRLKSQ
jgi:autotransporter-associated beta strand protein